MKKVSRLVLLFLLSGLMIIFSNIILTGLPVSARSVDQTSLPATANDTKVSQIITGPDSIYVQQIDGVTITHSSPALANFPVFFTATITSSVMPPGGLQASALSIFYAWSFGDRLNSVGINSTVSHTYTAPATYTVVVTVIDTLEIDVATQTILLPVLRPEQLFLPVVFKNHTAPPADLTCSLTIDPPNPSPNQPILITVQIENQGEGNADGFWIDLYINPKAPPISGRNNRLRWQDACGGPDSCPRGIAWRISDDPLPFGESKPLVSIPDNFNPPDSQGFDPDSSIWASGILPSGSYKFYAYVDSINGQDETIDGAVKEENEDNNRCEGDLVVPASVNINRPASSTLPKR